MRARYTRVVLALVVLVAAGCKGDLPEQQLASGQAPTGTSETSGTAGTSANASDSPAGKSGGQTATATADGGVDDDGAGAGGTSGSKPSAGTSGATSSSGGSGAANSGGAPSSSPAGGQSGGGQAPAGRAVAACMGRMGETVCDGAMLVVCGEDATAASRMNCMTAAQCLAGIAAGGGKCGSCDPGEVRCTEAMLEECNMAGEFEAKEMCPTAALCSEKNKSCDPAGCEPDAYTCESGALMKCKEDRTEFQMEEVCDSPELCDAAGKKCNKCAPSSAMCKDDSTLATCSADGQQLMAAPCNAPTAKCAMASNKCVQCTSNDDCQPMNECMVGMCNMGTGMCAAETPKTRGTTCGGGKCDALGTCAECLDNTDCSDSERCVTGFGCQARFPIEVTPGLLSNGSFYVNVSPGYAVEMSATGLNESVAVTGTIRGNCRSLNNSERTCKTSKNTTSAVQTLTLSGSQGAYCGLRSLLAGDSVTLSFEMSAPDPMASALTPARCDDGDVTLSAVTD